MTPKMTPKRGQKMTPNGVKNWGRKMGRKMTSKRGQKMTPFGGQKTKK